jgi:hypothetical protein
VRIAGPLTRKQGDSLRAKGDVSRRSAKTSTGRLLLSMEGVAQTVAARGTPTRSGLCESFVVRFLKKPHKGSHGLALGLCNSSMKRSYHATGPLGSAFTRKEEQATTIGSACARHLGVNDSHYTCMRELGRRGSRDRQRPAQH